MVKFSKLKLMLFKIKNLEYQILNKKILSNLNFNIEEGKHLLILGSSGSGKTSLLNLMSGLLKPTKGEIFFEDLDGIANDIEPTSTNIAIESTIYSILII